MDSNRPLYPPPSILAQFPCPPPRVSQQRAPRFCNDVTMSLVFPSKQPDMSLTGRKSSALPLINVNLCFVVISPFWVVNPQQQEKVQIRSWCVVKHRR